MKIDLRNYEIGKHYLIEDDVDFSNHQFASNYRIRKILNCHLKLDLVVFEDIANMKLQLNGSVIGACSYTNEDVEVKYHVKENLSFSNDENSHADYYEKNPLFDFDPYLLALIDANVPLNIIKKGAKMPESGEGYEVLSEEEYNKKKSGGGGDSRWAALDNINFDDDDED